jgi:CBS domain-containing protein
VNVESEVGEAVTIMLGLSVRHLPVMEGGEVVGMVPIRDLVGPGSRPGTQ